MNSFLIRIGVALLCVLVGAGALADTHAATAAALQSPGGAAQSPGAVVSGTIRDQTGAVVVNAEVQMLNLASGRQLKAKTDSAGKYELTGLPPGPYQISVSSEGFAAAARSISVRRNDSYREDFLLAPGAIEIDITVTAGKGNARVVAETAQIVTVTGASQIEERRPASTLRAIERAPNLTPVIGNPALERPRLRGLASNRLLIILDGERLNNMRSDPTSGVSPSIVDVTQLESAEVLSGAGSSLYGSDAMAGVINLITAGPVRNDYLGLRFNSDFRTNGLFRRGAATINWSRPSFAVRFGGSLFREANYQAGNQSISLGDVVRLGKLAADMGNAVGNNVARTWCRQEVWLVLLVTHKPVGAKNPVDVSSRSFETEDEAEELRILSLSATHVDFRTVSRQHRNNNYVFVVYPWRDLAQSSRAASVQVEKSKVNPD